MAIFPSKDPDQSSKAQRVKELLATAFVHHQNGQLAEANLLYKRTREIEPNNILAIQLSGVLAYQLKQFELSLTLLSRAIALKPNYAEALDNRGLVLMELKRFAEALVDFNKSVALKPHCANALINRGRTLTELRRFNEALADFNKAITLKPDHVQALINRGNLLKELQRFDEALVDFNKAIALKPDHVSVLNNRGRILTELRRFDEALADFNKAISINPDYRDAHLNKSLQLLLKGEFASGWELYEWRRKGTPKRNFTEPLWSGKEDLRSKTILLSCEQGLGDTIQFSRFARNVADLGCKTFLEVQKPLFELMKSVDGVDEVIVSSADLAPFDFYCPLMSLPLAFGTSVDTVPSAIPYIRVTEDKLAEWSNKLGPKLKPRVGIVWSGNASHKNDRNRSIELEQILLAVPEGYEIVSLQKEVRRADQNILAHLEKLEFFKHFGEGLQDFTDTAALCELMDIIVSVDTSVAHLGGALGKPVNLLLPYSPDFRWLLDRHDSPWYPTMKLFRQGADRLWKPTLQNASADLTNFIQSSRLDV